MAFKGKDLTGQKFGRLTALYPTDKREGKGYIVWVMKCDCGNIEERSLHSLNARSGIHGRRKKKIPMCCECREKYNSTSKQTHGDSKTRLYAVHRTMLQRCENPNAHEYENYGGRGITVCDEWHNYEPFKEWAMANGYKEDKRGKCTLDRIDTNKGYSPDNCRFVDMKTQQRNRRNNIRLTLDGVTKTMSEWAELTGTQLGTMQKRYEYGWSVRDIIYGKQG